MKSEIFAKLKAAVLDGDTDQSYALVDSALKENIPAPEIIEVVSSSLDEVGKKYETGEFFLPDLIVSGETGKEVIDKLAPYLKGSNAKSKGTVVLGTVEGDLHDIGKTLVLTMLVSAGFTVYDIGIDVKASVFVEKAKEHNADIIASSALLSTTKDKMIEIERAVKDAGLKGKVKTLIGGAVVSEKFAREIGADGYASNAAAAATIAQNLLR